MSPRLASFSSSPALIRMFWSVCAWFRNIFRTRCSAPGPKKRSTIAGDRSISLIAELIHATERRTICV